MHIREVLCNDNVKENVTWFPDNEVDKRILRLVVSCFVVMIHKK